MAYTIRTCNLPEDYTRMAEIISTGSWETETTAALARMDADFPAEGLRHRLVAEDHSAGVIAYGSAYRMGYEEPGLFSVKVTTDPAFRRRGVATALLLLLEGWARSQGATRLISHFRDDDPAFIGFAVRHGYVEQGHHYGCMLEIQTFDETPWVGAIRRLESEGVRFQSMAEPHDERLEHSLYEMERDAMHDEPGSEDEIFPPYELWREETLAQNPDLVVVAVDGDAVVGMTHISPAGENMRTHFTGVARTYRGREIALAVKLLVIRAAKARGARWIKTGSDSRNVAMQRINQRLGYVPMPGMYICIKG